MRKLEGLRTLTPRDTLEVLYRLAALVPRDEAIVEIGTYRGASACWLAAGAETGQGAHVYTIDPHDLPGKRTTTGRGKGGLDFTQTEIREHAEKQIRDCGLSERVTMIRGFSTEVAKYWNGPPVGLLFVDGDHRQNAATEDFRAWQPHMTRETVIAWDDYAPSHPGVPAAVQGLVDKRAITPPVVYDRVAVTSLTLPEERALEIGT